MRGLNVTQLEKGKRYHIRNGYAMHRDYLWISDCILVDIEENWEDPTILTFQQPSGKMIVIDGDFITESDMNRYQVIASRKELVPWKILKKRIKSTLPIFFNH